MTKTPTRKTDAWGTLIAIHFGLCNGGILSPMVPRKNQKQLNTRATRRETPHAIEERGIGSTKYARVSSRSMGKRKVELLALVFIALMLTIYAFYQSKWVLGTRIWRWGFGAFTIVIGVWLTVGIVRSLESANHDAGHAGKPTAESYIWSGRGSGRRGSRW